MRVQVSGPEGCSGGARFARKKKGGQALRGGHWGVGTKDLAAKGRDWGASDSWSSARDRWFTCDQEIVAGGLAYYTPSK